MYIKCIAFPNTVDKGSGYTEIMNLGNLKRPKSLWYNKGIVGSI